MEIWKDIEEYEGRYQINECGEVKSLAKFRNNAKVTYLQPERILTNNVDTNGYLSTKLSKDKVARRFRIHVMVAKAFIPNPLNLPEVNHKDGIKTNCCVDNLEWCTSKENKQHAFRTGLMNANHLHKLSTQQVKEIRSSIGKTSRKEFAIKFGVCRETIDGVINNRNYKKETYGNI